MNTLKRMFLPSLHTCPNCQNLVEELYYIDDRAMCDSCYYALVANRKRQHERQQEEKANNEKT